MPAYLFGGYMFEKSVRPRLSQRQAAADCINQPLRSRIAPKFVTPLAPPPICITCQTLRKNLELKDRAFIELFPVGQRVQISKPF